MIEIIRKQGAASCANQHVWRAEQERTRRTGYSRSYGPSREDTVHPDCPRCGERAVHFTPRRAQ